MANLVPRVLSYSDRVEEDPGNEVERWQHVNAIYRNIVGRNMLRAFGHRVAMCCAMLGVVGSNLIIFKLEPTTPNVSQHIATRWPIARNMLRPTMLRYVALACCERKSLIISRSFYNITISFTTLISFEVTRNIPG